MKLIEISHVQKSKSSEPAISFTLSGNIRLNVAAVRKLNEDAFKSSEKFYLHFYQQDGKLYCKFDQDPKEGIYVRFDGSQDRESATNIVSSAKAVIQYFTKLMDWPLAENKKKFIRYTVGEEVQPNNASPFSGIFELN